MPDRVAHISTVHVWNDGRIFERELKTIAHAGFEVVWFAVADEPNPPELSGITLHALPRRRLIHRILQMPSLIRQATSVRAGLYHIHDPELMPAALLIRARTSGLIVYDKHEYQRGRRGLKAMITRLVERVLAPFFDAVVVVECVNVAAEGGCAEPDLDDVGIGQSAILHLPNYPLELPRSASDDAFNFDDTLRIVSAGVQAPERGLWFMLDALEEIVRRRREVELTLVGLCHRESDRQSFEQVVNARGLTAHVRFVGWDRYVPWETVMGTAAGADVGLMLMDPRYRLWSNIPTKFYEYMHLALPFVCTKYSNWSAFTDRFDCGIAVDPLDPVEVADAILDIADDAETYARMALNGATAAQEFTWAAVESRLTGLYEDFGLKTTG